jgi:hypothetical protein
LKPIKFAEQNCTIGANQKEYIPLPAYKDVEGYVVTCWSVTWLEKIKILFTGKCYVSFLTFLSPKKEKPIHKKKRSVRWPNNLQHTCVSADFADFANNFIILYYSIFFKTFLLLFSPFLFLHSLKFS